MTIQAEIWEEQNPDNPGFMTRHWAKCGDHEAYVDSRGDAAMKLARKLVAAGFDRDQPYELTRKGKVALIFTSLGWAADHTVKEGNKTEIHFAVFDDLERLAELREAE